MLVNQSGSCNVSHNAVGYRGGQWHQSCDQLVVLFGYVVSKWDDFQERVQPDAGQSTTIKCCLLLTLCLDLFWRSLAFPKSSSFHLVALSFFVAVNFLFYFDGLLLRLILFWVTSLAPSVLISSDTLFIVLPFFLDGPYCPQYQFPLVPPWSISCPGSSGKHCFFL